MSQRRRTSARACRPGNGGERSEPPGKRSAQRPKGAEARGIPARRAETAQRARQGSPVAKRRAQTHRRVRHRAHHHRHHRRHRPHHHRHRRRQRMHRRHHHRRHHDRRWRGNQRQHRRRCWQYVVVAPGDPVNADVSSMVNGQVRGVVRRKGGGAAAERGAAGDARREGEPCGGAGSPSGAVAADRRSASDSEPEHERGAKRARGRALPRARCAHAETGRAAAGATTRPVEAVPATRRSGAPGCRAAAPCRRGSR